MLRRSFTAVVERNVWLQSGFVTEPYETGWAMEARWFVHVLEAQAGTRATFASETSPEGLTWCPHEAAPVASVGIGMATLALTNVGPWQRLVCTLDQGARARAIIYLTLKG